MPRLSGFKSPFLFFIFTLAVLVLHCYLQAFSSCGKQGLIFVAVHSHSFSLTWLLLLWHLDSGAHRLQYCGLQAQELQPVGSRVWARQLWHVSSLAPCHVGSSQTRDETHVLCIGRWILNHWTTRESQASNLFFFKFSNHRNTEGIV